MTMWLLFDLDTSRILGAAPDPVQLRFEEDEWPAHLASVRRTTIEAIDDHWFLMSRKNWPEMSLRRLYMFLKLSPPLTPTKFSDAAYMDMRMRIRTGIATQLGLEPNKLPILEAPKPVVSAPPPAPRAPRLPTARRGSVGPIIHRVATEMWEAAGSPRDVPTLLQLRQTIMKVLNDEHKVKLATSSNELGRWQKQLLAI
jgi:hypothetical protein